MKQHAWQDLIVLVILCTLFIKTSALCNNTDKVRLAGGQKEGEGRLEMKHKGTGDWVSVCPDRWSTRNAGVACEELCGERKYATTLPANDHFEPPPSGQLTGVFNVSCYGYETSIANCRQVQSIVGRCRNPVNVGLCCHNGCDGINHIWYPKPQRAAICELFNIGLSVQLPSAPVDRPDLIYILNLTVSSQPCALAKTERNATHISIRVPHLACNTQISGNLTMMNSNQTFKINMEVKDRAISRFFTYISPVTCSIQLVPPTLPTAEPTTTAQQSSSSTTSGTTAQQSSSSATGRPTSSVGSSSSSSPSTSHAPTTTRQSEETSTTTTSTTTTIPLTSVPASSTETARSTSTTVRRSTVTTTQRPHTRTSIAMSTTHTIPSTVKSTSATKGTTGTAGQHSTSSTMPPRPPTTRTSIPLSTRTSTRVTDSSSKSSSKASSQATKPSTRTTTTSTSSQKTTLRSTPGTTRPTTTMTTSTSLPTTEEIPDFPCLNPLLDCSSSEEYYE